MAVLKTIIGNVRGPKGDKGDQGIQGPVGPVGPKGDMPDITGKLDKGNLPSNLQNAEQIYNELKKITDTLETKKLDMGTLPDTVTNAGILLKLIAKQAGGQFDPNVIYLNFVGETKKDGYLYFDFNWPGIFKCIKETQRGDNTPEYFVNVSNLENSDRLSNLNDVKLIFNNTQGAVETGILNLDDSIENFKFIQIIYQFGGSISIPEGFISDLYPVSFLKQNYNKGIIRGSSTYEKDVIFVEHFYFCLRNKNQIEIFENFSSMSGATSNNRIYKIYAWN